VKLACRGRALVSFPAELAQVRLGQLDDLLAPAGEDCSQGEEAETLGLLQGDLGRYGQLLASDVNIHQGRAVVGERGLQCSFKLIGLFHAGGEQTGRLGVIALQLRGPLPVPTRSPPMGYGKPCRSPATRIKTAAQVRYGRHASEIILSSSAEATVALR
jgi:hypothetical protein